MPNSCSSTPSLVTSSLLLIILPLLLVLHPTPSSFRFSLPPPSSISPFPRPPYYPSPSSSSPSSSTYKGEENDPSIWNEEKRGSSTSQTSLPAQPPPSVHYSYEHRHHQAASALPPTQVSYLKVDQTSFLFIYLLLGNIFDCLNL